MQRTMPQVNSAASREQGAGGRQEAAGGRQQTADIREQRAERTQRQLADNRENATAGSRELVNAHVIVLLQTELQCEPHITRPVSTTAVMHLHTTSSTPTWAAVLHEVPSQAPLKAPHQRSSGRHTQLLHDVSSEGWSHALQAAAHNTCTATRASTHGRTDNYHKLQRVGSAVYYEGATVSGHQLLFQAAPRALQIKLGRMRHVWMPSRQAG